MRYVAKLAVGSTGHPEQNDSIESGNVRMKASSQSLDLSYLGLDRSEATRNMAPAALVEDSVARGEGIIAENGALVVETGKYTGRSPKDRYIVDAPSVHESIAWGNANQPISEDAFEALWEKAIEFANGKRMYVFDGFVGADRDHAKRIRVIGDSASQNLFIHQLLVRPTDEELEAFGDGEYTVLALPDLKLDGEQDGVRGDAAVVLDFPGKRILVAGTGYSGEIKKAIFTTMNYLMPQEGVLPMHCSANMDPKDGSVAIFFGLSGTGKTTLSADPSREVIGDDEHGWSDDGVFNFEGGCYAKCIDLSQEKEPSIFEAIRFGSVLENVAIDDETREVDYSDGSITDNTRGAYPVTNLSRFVASGKGESPSAILFLTADAFGVMPPISKLSPEAAMYHFVTGFTSKVAGTECGVTEPEPTFSSMFGEPFMPRSAEVYAEMLGERIRNDEVQVYLVNTGWAGGSAASGAERIPLRYTRAMVDAALSGELQDAEFEYDEVFGVDVPKDIEGVPTELLHPKRYWKLQGRPEADYDAAANELALLFQRNFEDRHSQMSESIAKAGPHPK